MGLPVVNFNSVRWRRGLSFGEILGLAAGVFSTGAILPQVIRIFKYKSATDVSLLFSIMLLVGGLLWLLYGIFDKLLPIILWNVLGVGLTSTLLIGKVKFDAINRKKTVKT
jgi:MtN3 and saliva related transmembrane protein